MKIFFIWLMLELSTFSMSYSMLSPTQEQLGKLHDLIVKIFSSEASIKYCSNQERLTCQLHDLIGKERLADSQEVSPQVYSSIVALLEQGADANRSSEMCTTPLCAAIATQKYDLVELLLAYGADVTKPSILTQTVSSEEATPLHWAAYYFNPRIFYLLLDAGADITSGTIQSRRTIFDLAAEGCHQVRDQIKWLEVQTNLPRILASKCPLSTRNGNSLPPYMFPKPAAIHRHSASGCLENIKKVAPEKINFCREMPFGMSPFHWAAARGHVEVLTYLLEQYKKLDAPQENYKPTQEEKYIFNLENASHDTAMDLALYNDNSKCVELLTQAGGILKTQRGIHAALQRRDVKFIKETLSDSNGLLFKDLTFHDYDQNGSPPLHRAASQPNTLFLNMFLRAGADPYIRNIKNITALQTALSNPCPGDLTHLCSEIIAPLLTVLSKAQLMSSDVTTASTVYIAPELCCYLAHFVGYSHLQESNPYKSHKARGRELFEAIKNLKLVAKTPDIDYSFQKLP